MEVKKGDLWQLGDHKLYCGDSTDPAAFIAVMQDEKADMVFTDPPYNVDYHSRRIYRDGIANDKISEKEYERLLRSAIENLQNFSKSGAACYTCMAGVNLEILIRLFRENNYHMSTLIVWVKNQFTIGWADYQNQHEPIYYGWKRGAPRLHPVADRAQSNVWRVKKPQKSPLHPTMKPLELVERAVQNSSAEDEIVLDPFGGSGTTLIACENLKRRCRMIEIDPAYCATIIDRYSEICSKKVKKL